MISGLFPILYIGTEYLQFYCLLRPFLPYRSRTFLKFFPHSFMLVVYSHPDSFYMHLNLLFHGLLLLLQLLNRLCRCCCLDLICRQLSLISGLYFCQHFSRSSQHPVVVLQQLSLLLLRLFSHLHLCFLKDFVLHHQRLGLLLNFYPCLIEPLPLPVILLFHLLVISIELI